MHIGTSIKTLKNGTNILDINIPPQLERLVETGVPWFDEACGSPEAPGVTPSMVTMFTGTPGAGKTTTMLQLADSITKAGHVCLFNTGEESLYQVRKVAKRLGIQDGFIAGQDVMVDDVLRHADGLLKAIKAEAAETKRRQKQLFIICDSLQTLDDGKYKNGVNSMTPVRCALRLAEYCKTNFASAILIGQVTKSGQFSGKQALKHIVDAHAHLEICTDSKSDNYGKRIFKMMKNRFGAASMDGTLLEMTATGLKRVGTFEGDYEEDKE